MSDRDLSSAFKEAKAARLTSAHCLYRAECPLKLRCCFKHTAQEIAYFYYYEDYDGDSDKQISLLSCDSCQESVCLHCNECICNEIDHPHWIANEYSDSDDPDETQNPHHDDPAPGIDTSDYSSGDDTDPYVNTQYWAEGGWTDFCFNRDIWAISLEEGTYGYATFQADDGNKHQLCAQPTIHWR